ncbi:hypothetical protein W97_02030 [Coniosporium apollinis CBS 100218]|uniref:Galactose oxidase-like Early set domain-containing protein n=1 Tax=Coniosporium apollinis (strain CBS 100218) TaxID=1168221 RepID=R7YLL8_CONA1|nr:uncharacterized protein W97_02030 [Coniosporium apollinis CBS 100218]EON62805.1 hypothetical protein W97_02030 [Coniosporium apollinis CBS 100218]
MRTSHLLGLPASLLLLLAAPSAAQLPYNPTRILSPPRNETNDLLYVFRPSPASANQFELLSLDLSSEARADNLPLTTLYPSLPFLDADTAKAFASVIDSNGDITVYTGDCADGPSGAELWKFVARRSARNGNGSWVQEKLSLDPAEEHRALAGPNYLASSIAFSGIVGEDGPESSMYIFGGMCPFEDASQDEWTSAANYSNLMVNLDPAATPNEFEFGLTASRGPPIAEAGFSITPLLPTFSNNSDGSQNQQQNFVLLGGHTETAFINMSQVALFSLPEEAWAFLPVEQASKDHTYLAARDAVTPTSPRSGHTAVLTPDGQRIVVLGGWVGDVNTPAEPQLAVLNVGAGYGGKTEWSWTFPPLSSDGLAQGTGLYGHGAVMLPGDVMMVMGGYSIPATLSRRLRVRTTQNTRNLFYNVTSNTWLPSYTLPPDASDGAQPHSGPLSSTSQKAGLGVGVAVGFAAVVGLVLFYFWFAHRQKKQREFRDKELRELGLSAQSFNANGYGEGGIDGRGGNMSAAGFLGDREMAAYTAYPWSNGRPARGGQGYRRVSAGDAQRTGVLVEVPSPTRGLRRGANPRGNYHPAPRYDEKRRSRGSGTIHPIKESEEEEHTPAGIVPHSGGLPEMSERDRIDNRASLFSQAPTLDPFSDPDPLGSHPVSAVSPSPARARPTSSSCPVSPIEEGNAGPQARALEWERAADRLLHDLTHPNSTESSSPGRTSPSHSGESRTGSNLSDRSVWSNVSARSSSGGAAVSVARSISIRSANLLNSITNPFSTPNTSPPNDSPPETREGLRPRAFTTGARPGSQGAESFMTAQTSFAALQAEGEAILGGRPDRYRDDPSSPVHPPSPIATVGLLREKPSPEETPAPSPSKEKPRLSWMGSVRRALSRGKTNAGAGRTVSMISAHAPTPVLEPYRDNPSPVHGASKLATAPRRAVSDATPWRYRRGARDWDESNALGDVEDIWRRTSGDDWGSPEDRKMKEREEEREQQEAEREWDVEAAAERRVVQVTFTVPRMRLRVVNADVDGASLVSREECGVEKGEVEAEGSGGIVEEDGGRLLKVSSREEDGVGVRSKSSRVLALARSFEQRAESPATGEGSRGLRDTGGARSIAAPYVRNGL